MSELLRDWWQAIAAAAGWTVGSLWWLFNVDQRGKSNAAAIRGLHALRNEDRVAATESRQQLHDMLMEVQRDVKVLLARKD